MVTLNARALILAAGLGIGWSSGAVIAHPPQLLPGQRVRPPAGTATVSGMVVDSAQPPRPVRRARVTLHAGNDAIGWSVTTDDDGRFAIAGVAAGRYVLEAQKPAWIIGRYGASRPGRPGIPIVVNESATVQGLRIAMSRGAAISGTVLSRSGAPVPGVVVSAVGARGRSPDTEVTTDDEGRFRLFGLAPGEYAVLATLRIGPSTALMEMTSQTQAQVEASLRGAPIPAAGTVGYASVYAPGVVSRAQAMTIKLAAEEERDGVTVALNPVPTARITVTIDTGETGDPASVQLSLSSGDAAGSSLPGRRGGDGRYVFSGVAPVPYTAIARAARLGAAPAVSAPVVPAARGRGATAPLTLYAIEDLTVTGGEMNVSLRLQPGMTVSGRVVSEAGATPDTRFSDLSFGLLPLREGPALGVPSVRSNADGVFVFEGVPPGRYRLTPAGSTAFNMKTAISRGVDVLDVMLDVRAGEDVIDLVVTLSARPTELTGRLETAAGAAAPDYYIVAFAADRQYWTPESRRILQTRPATDGRYSMKGLPAGEYLIAALTDVEPGEWFDSAFLAGLAQGALRVTVRDGATTTQDLRLR